MSNNDDNDDCVTPPAGLPLSGSTPTGSGFGGGGAPGGTPPSGGINGGTGYPTSPTSTPSPFPVFIPDPSIKGVSFDQLIQNRGIRFIHRKATPCPNMQTVFDNSHNPNCAICDGGGIMYYQEKEIWGLFVSNSLEKNFEMQGIWEIGQAVVTLPVEYPDGSPAEFNTFDQLVIPDFLSRMWELMEYKPTVNNQQRLRYPIDRIEFLGSAVNNALVTFTSPTNFSVSATGNIQWVPGFTPQYNATDERGDVFVVQYYAHPVYNVLQHLRELRISQELVGGRKVAKRLPQQILVRRDFLNNPPNKT